MYRQPPEMTEELIKNATARAVKRLKEVPIIAAAAAGDPKKDKREKEQLCKTCFYSPPRIGGAAMTQTECMCCDTPMMFGSTATDLLCTPCAQKEGLCRQCGANLADMENATGKEPPTAV